jgi:lysozyme
MKKRSKKERKRRRRLLIWTVVLFLGIALSWFVFAYRYKIYNYARHLYYSNHKPAPKKINKTYPLGVPVPKNYSVFGTDVSRHQGRIDWEELSKFRFNGKKIEFVFIKATEGATWEDPEFNYNWRKARKYGILRGAYHFYRPKIHSSQQMKNFTDKVEMKAGDLPPVLDVEIESSLPKSTYRKGVLNCLKIMERTYGVTPIIYTNQKLYREYFKTQEFARFHFWISRLQRTPPRNSDWDFWQFTYEAVLPGTDEYVDINVYNGSLEQLKKILKK